MQKYFHNGLTVNTYYGHQIVVEQTVRFARLYCSLDECDVRRNVSDVSTNDKRHMYFFYLKFEINACWK